MGRRRAADVIAADTSALLAIVFDEPERDAFLDIVRASGRTLVSAMSVVEARMVVHGRKGQPGVILLDDILRQPAFEMVSPDTRQVEIAYGAFVAYGRGSGHPAALNFGDVFSYALAKSRGVPLLYKGDDFMRTDLERAMSR
ncbi:MAG TPA: type II toxin-antitoxin system VapC family toxin [Gemmatimonas sp.]|nr:type II toxin-antitoxin system VapC family toxin [Gemmatimonas sp.]